MAIQVVEVGMCSRRSACLILHLARSTYEYQGRAASSAEQQVKTIYIDPGSPWQNGFVESFHGRFRDECLNREQLWTLTEARVVIEDCRRQYNEFRPHSKLGYQSPARFAAQAHPASAPVGLRPPCAEAGQTTTHQLNTTTKKNSPLD